MEQGNSFESELRLALQRAEDGNSRPMAYGTSITPYVEHLPAEIIGTMIVERLVIKKVDIKVEVSAFIDQHFTSRTGSDGTILNLSKESLVEELTMLFYGLEERSSQIDDPKVKKSPSDRSRKSQSSDRESVSP